MKNIELLGISAAAAVLILTGCSDDSNGDSEPSAPSEVTQAADMNISQTKTVISFIQDGGIMAGSPRLAVMKASLVAKADSLPGSGGGSGTETTDCEISGTKVHTWKSEWIQSDDGSRSDNYSDTYTYNNCIDGSSTTVQSETMTQYVQKGSLSFYGSQTYNSDSALIGRIERQTFNNYSERYESNTSLTSRTTTNDYTFEMKIGIEPAIVQSQTLSVKGTAEQDVETNSTGHIVDGLTGSYNLTQTVEEGDDHEKVAINGFYAVYDINASGSFINESRYYKDYLLEFTHDTSNDSNITVSGTLGNTCLGGSVTLSTNPVIRENSVDYFDGDDKNKSSGGDVLPYTGAMSIVGMTNATVTFDTNETNNTSAFIQAGETNATAYFWNDLDERTCVPQP